MPVKIYWIHNFENAAKLGIMARPRGGDWLEDDIISLNQQKVHTVVSLLEREEIDELDLKHEALHCTNHGLAYTNFPIPDRSIPRQGHQLQTFLEQLQTEIAAGHNMVIHCRMGIGRSSIIAAALIIKPGYSTTQVLSHITKIRGIRVPDTDEQINWLNRR